MTLTELNCFMGLLRTAPEGTRIEFGVYRGATLRLIAQHNGATLGIDSFEGMPAPTVRDVKEGWNPYPKGRLSSDYAAVKAEFDKYHSVMILKGWVPEILKSLGDARFAFAHVDLDQYDSTLGTLQWLSTRMIDGGIICCDDYFADRDWLAGGAINEFIRTVRPLSGAHGRKAWFTW